MCTKLVFWKVLTLRNSAAAIHHYFCGKLLLSMYLCIYLFIHYLFVYLFSYLWPLQSIQWLEHWNTEESVFDSRHCHKVFSSQSLRHHRTHVASFSISRKKRDRNINLTSHIHLERWLKCSEFHLHSSIRINGVAFGQVRNECREETRDYKRI